MTWTYKHRGGVRVRASEYFCEVHGRFELDVEVENGDVPDSVPCPLPADDGDADYGQCGLEAIWVISNPFGKVKRVEVVRGKWEKPERPTFYDTRELGEGMPLDEWKEKRRKIRDEERKAQVQRMAKGEE